MSEIYDIAIIGTGPAGISAAITATARNKKIIFFGSANISDKVKKAHRILNYPGIPDVSGEELAERLLAHLRQMSIDIDERQVNTVYKMGDGYKLQLGQKFIDAKTVILAMGVHFDKPYPGEEEFLGRGVSYCATCDAPLYKGKTVVIVGYSPKHEAEAEFMAELTAKVYYIPQYEGEVTFYHKEGSCDIEVAYGTPVSIEGQLKAERLITDKGAIEADGIFLLRESISPGQLVPGLTLDGNHVAVDRAMRTSLAGCFACGDITGPPYQYVKAAGEGNVAALSAVSYLAEQK